MTAMRGGTRPSDGDGTPALSRRAFGIAAAGAGVTAALVGCTSSSGAGSKQSAASTAAAAAGSGSIDTGNYTLGFLQLQGGNPGSDAALASLQQATKMLGWKFSTYDPAGDPTKTALGANTLVNAGVDAMITYAADPSVISQALQTAKAHNIPVIAIVGTVAGAGYTANYDVPFDAMSVLLNDYMFATLSSGAEIAALTIGGYIMYPRIMDILNAMCDARGFKLVAQHQINLQNPVQDSVSGAQQMLSAHPSVEAIWVPADFSFAPVVASLTTAGQKAKVFGLVLDPDGAAALRAGGAAGAVIDTPQYYKAWQATNAFLLYFTKHTPITLLGNYSPMPPFALVAPGNAPSGGSVSYPDPSTIFRDSWTALGYKLNA